MKTRWCLMWAGIAGLLSLGVVPMSVAQLSPDDVAALQERARTESWSFMVGETSVSHLPLEALCGAVEPPNWQETSPKVEFPTVRSLPTEFDWRNPPAGYPVGVTPVRNQGGCGACWAFGTVGALECSIRIRDGVAVDLSEQWLVSCNIDDMGCDGGWIAFGYYLDRPDSCGGVGSVMETEFPYVAYDAPCNCPYSHRYAIHGWAQVAPSGNVVAIKQAIMDYGPVACGVAVQGNFGAYTGGVFNEYTGGDINHVVCLVGWDDEFDWMGETYGVWIMRNSWGSGWGDNGYMYITYDTARIGHGAAFVDYRASTDCNGNGVSDYQDLVSGTSVDCNENELPDECDVAAGTSADCNGNDVPDECDVMYGAPKWSDEPNAVLGWQEIGGSGTALNLGDDGYAVVPLPFSSVLFPGSAVVVHNNGGLGFGASTSLPASNNPVPSADAFEGDAALLPYWDDLDSDTGNVYHAVVGTAPERVFVVEWKDRPHYAGDTALDGDEVTFQAQIFETPVVGIFAQILYQDTDFNDPTLNHGRSATVGYQADAEEGALWSFNESASVVGPDTVLSLYGDLPTSWDVNGNGIPDECEAGGCRGDCDCDGDIDYFDINYLIAALGGEVAWADHYRSQNGGADPPCSYFTNCDVDGNGGVDYFDINPFLDVLGQECP